MRLSVITRHVIIFGAAAGILFVLFLFTLLSPILLPLPFGISGAFAGACLAREKRPQASRGLYILGFCAGFVLGGLWIIGSYIHLLFAEPTPDQSKEFYELFIVGFTIVGGLSTAIIGLPVTMNKAARYFIKVLAGALAFTIGSIVGGIVIVALREMSVILAFIIGVILSFVIGGALFGAVSNYGGYEGEKVVTPKDSIS